MTFDFLAGKEPLAHRVEIFVPSTYAVDIIISNTPFVLAVEKRLSELFGGGTAQKATGSWFSDEKQEVIHEDISIVYANCTEASLKKYAREAFQIAADLAVQMKQEAVTIVVDGKMYFIEQGEMFTEQQISVENGIPEYAKDAMENEMRNLARNMMYFHIHDMEKEYNLNKEEVALAEKWLGTKKLVSCYHYPEPVEPDMKEFEALLTKSRAEKVNA